MHPTTSTMSGLRVNRGAEAEPWGPNAYVVATQFVLGKTVSYPLDCSPFYEYLRCKNPADKPTSTPATGFRITDSATFHIYDGDFTGGPIQGEVKLPSCWINDAERNKPGWTACKDPLVLSMTRPKWSEADDGWKFTMTLVNVSKDGVAYLDNIRSGPIKCPSDWDLPCTAEFVILPEKFDETQDSMTFKALDDDDGSQIGETSEILNLRQQISPYLTSIEGDHAGFTGINIAFTEAQFNQDPKGRIIPLNCTGPIGGKRRCSMDLKKSEHGFLFFRTPGGDHVPFMLVDKNGNIEPVAEHRSNEPRPTATTDPQSKQPTSESTVVNIIQNTSPLLIRKDQ